jgi:energy-coupling factor transporter ATP-binding protein EcfA2
MQLHAPELATELERRLLRGEHLTLFGPRGSGKSTLLRKLHSHIIAAGIPCAYSSITSSLDDVTRALERAYPGVHTEEISRRAARARLWMAADQRSGVLLLDHFSSVTNAMVFLLKRLHGKIAGVLTAVDVDDQRERSRIRRPSRYGAMSVSMPITPTRQLRRLLYTLTGGLGLPLLAPGIEQKLLESARGRPGWIVKCMELACEPQYWCEHGLLVSTLCVDTEAAVRYQALDMLRPPPAAQDQTPAYHPIDSGQVFMEASLGVSALITPKQTRV